MSGPEATDTKIVKEFKNLAGAPVTVIELPADPRRDPRNHYQWNCAGCGEAVPFQVALFVAETRAGRHADECDTPPPELPESPEAPQ